MNVTSNYNPISTASWDTTTKVVPDASFNLNQKIIFTVTAAFVVLGTTIYIYYTRSSNAHISVKQPQQTQTPLDTIHNVVQAVNSAQTILTSITNRIQGEDDPSIRSSYESNINASRQILESATRNHHFQSEHELREILKALVTLTVSAFLDKQADISFETSQKIVRNCLTLGYLQGLLNFLIPSIREDKITPDYALSRIEAYCEKEFNSINPSREP